jgi:hypothetical protein
MTGRSGKNGNSLRIVLQAGLVMIPLLPAPECPYLRSSPGRPGFHRPAPGRSRLVGMGKSQSPLQRDILAVLEEWPTFELAEAAAPGSVRDWALPRDIIGRLGLPKTGSTRSTVSRALLRLHQKGLVARASGELADVGKSYHYLRITNPANAGAGNDGPSIILGTARRHIKHARE